MIEIAIEKLKAIGDNCPIEGGAAVEMCIGILEGLKSEYKILPEIAGLLIGNCPGSSTRGMLRAILQTNFDAWEEDLRVRHLEDNSVRITINPRKDFVIDAEKLCEFVASIPDCSGEHCVFSMVNVETVYTTKHRKPGWGYES